MPQDVAAALNPQFHDEFVALCALYHSGDISEEEWALLQIHMAYCDSCQHKFLEYQQITSDVIPAMAAVAASESDKQASESANSLESAERRLMSNLDSIPATKDMPGPRKRDWRLLGTLIAACLLGLASLLGYEISQMKDGFNARTTQSPGPTLASQANAAHDQDLQQALSRSQEEIVSLKQQVAESESRLKQVNLSAASIEKQLAAEEDVRRQLSEEKDQLNQQLVSAKAEINSMRNRLASLDTSQPASNSAVLETQVRELRAALDEKDEALNNKDRMLALDKDFLAHDRDIRDLIGARNLYIADIFDTTENGRTAKQFGRIFYTQDRSLIFYGFDLDSQASHKRDVSFQVWGSGSARPSPVSLGLFYQDDTHKRWVLRCNDAKTLARLDMVFVTVEPPGGSAKPTGKQLLRAYLQIHPNHP